MRPDEQRKIGATGVSIGVLGFGGASIGNLHRPVPAAQAEQAITAAYSASIRYFDTAPLYGAGLGEWRLGQALRAVPRSGFVLSTKVGHRLFPQAEAGEATDRLPFAVKFDYTYDGTMRSIEGSLHRTGLGSIDIAFIHDIDPYNHGAAQPEVFRAAMAGAWRALAALRSAGTLRAIGVGVNNVAVCEACLREADIDCFLLAGRYTLLDTAALDSLLADCTARGVAVIVGAPFNSGLLARGAASASTYNYVTPSAEVRARLAAIERVCAAHGVGLMAAALQFPLAHPAVVSVLPGMRSAAQVTACVQAMATDIPHAFWEELRRRGLIAAGAPLPSA